MTAAFYSPAQATADLRWVLDTPFLIPPSAEWNAPSLPDDLWTANDLTAFLQERHSHRVGYYFENLIQFWLERSVDVRELRRQIRITDSERTIGELDFAFRNNFGRLCHWEAAVKFYLYSPEPNAAGSHWLGPNARDYLEKKWKRLCEHQLPLATAHFEEAVASFPLVKGMLFYPFGKCNAATVPAFVNPEHQTGEWIRYRDLARFAAARSACHLLELEKPFWLAAPAWSVAEPFALSPDDWIARAAEEPALTTRPRFFSVFARSGEDWREQSRLFVVPDDWPTPPAK